ncbi:MAG: apolipoprotein N-acyltransferase [Casimicrobiaceae bacterium]|nr:apolipoprotein N-acyltransferase [Casimicrobiaceae bacterium]MDW8311613.1 apolipoprotein N-acyltransferase [Burkholderiales bacterium]
MALPLAALTGGLTAWLAFAPLGQAWFAFCAMAVLARLVAAQARATRAALLGFAFGLAYFLVGVGWVRISLHDFGGMPAHLAWFSALLFCLYLALWPALAAGITMALRPAGALSFASVFAAAWSFTEYLRAHLWTGFEWLSIAQSQAPEGPLAGFLPLFGGFGTAFLLTLAASLVAFALLPVPQAGPGTARDRLGWLAGATGVLLSAAAVSRIDWAQPAGTPLRVSLLQGNVAQSIKWEPEKLSATLALYERLTAQATGQLIVLPETALPTPLHRVDPAYLERLRNLAATRGANLLLGVPVLEQGRYYNAVVSLGSEPSQIYRKVHLVPFGEFMPLRWALGWFYANVTIPMSDFSPGRIDQPLLTLNGQRLGISICYEDAFARDVHRTMPDATLFVNVSNDAWFGKSRAAEQHLQLAQMRAREFARPMLRANNTGITAILDSRGRVLDRLPAWETGILEAEIRGAQGYSPYTLWGDLPALLVLLTVLGIATVQRLRGPSKAT